MNLCVHGDANYRRRVVGDKRNMNKKEKISSALRVHLVSLMCFVQLRSQRPHKRCMETSLLFSPYTLKFG